MSNRRLSRSTSWVAVLAAYVLVLQALVSGLAAGSFANALSIDRAFGIAFCAPGGETSGSPEHGATKTHADLSCCTLGCPVLTGGEPAAADFAVLPYRPADRVAFLRKLDRPVGHLSGHSPGNPRAPPAFA